MFDIGFGEILIVLFIAFLVFGPKRLPELGRTLGRAVRQMRTMSDGLREEIIGNLYEDQPAAEAASTPLDSVTFPAVLSSDRARESRLRQSRRVSGTRVRRRWLQPRTGRRVIPNGECPDGRRSRRVSSREQTPRTGSGSI